MLTEKIFTMGIYADLKLTLAANRLPNNGFCLKFIYLFYERCYHLLNKLSFNSFNVPLSCLKILIINLFKLLINFIINQYFMSIKNYIIIGKLSLSDSKNRKIIT